MRTSTIMNDPPLSGIAAGSAGPAWVADLRASGLAGFRAKGLPGKRVEAFKYTDLRGLGKIGFSPAADLRDAPVPEGILGLDAHHLVLVNGHVSARSALGDLPAGLSIRPLAEVLEHAPESLEGILCGQCDGPGDLRLVEMNTASLAAGVVIDVAAGTVVEKPLHLVCVAASGGEPVLSQPRVVVRVREGAALTLVESHVGTGAAAVLTNMTTDVKIEDGATLNHYRMQADALANTHLHTILAEVGGKARYASLALSTGAATSRAEVRVRLIGDGAAVALDGAYLGRGVQHMDHTTFVEHAVGGAVSTQLYKGVLDDAAHGVFQGKVVVARGADGTDGRQLHKALLLSRKAEVDCKPELEIYADDVKCAHGATTGEIDKDQLFYLQARGIGAEEAKGLLISAFVFEPLERVGDDDVRAALVQAVTAWLVGEGLSIGDDA